MKKFFPILLFIVVFAAGYGLYWWKYTYLHDKLFRTAELHNKETGGQTLTHLTPEENIMDEAEGAEGGQALSLFTPDENDRRTAPVAYRNLLINGNFENEFQNWQLWHSAKTFSNTVNLLKVTGKNFKNAVRIENPMKKLVGIQQLVKVKSNTVYRLCGSVRSTATNNNEIIFGGRIGFYLPGQKEKQIVWMSEHNQWWRKELIFTNQVTGAATVYVHMGYGNVASTGEFTNISLEKLGD